MHKFLYYRKLNNLTQAEVANLLGITTGAYYQYEAEKTEPSIRTLKELSKIFHTSIDELLDNNAFSKLAKPYQKALIDRILNYSEYECGLLLGYMDRIDIENRQREQEEKLKRIYAQQGEA